MHRKAIAGVALAVLLAINAAAVSTASAATKLTLSENGAALAPGTIFEGYGSFGVVTSEGVCSSGGDSLEVSVVTNSKRKDELAIYNYNAEFETCESDTGNAVGGLRSLGGTLDLGANGKVSGGPVALVIGFEHIEYKDRRYEDVECWYVGKRLTGTSTATTSRQKLSIELEGEVKLDPSLSSPKAKHLCPKTAEWGLSLPVTENEEGELIEEQTYTGR
ncbi:MAG TPA: hypothetical protein VMD79_11450 [Solirubrobacteraceae bacterium]|nr:hypothetical protein [Solirubrobacteraceae bacterium]